MKARQEKSTSLVLPRGDSIEHPETAKGTEIGLSGASATDRHGNALVHFDQAAERRLRLKIDLMIIPTVSLLYLFCFIDRVNIGMPISLLAGWSHVDYYRDGFLTRELTGNAKIAGLSKDLKLEGYDYNKILSIFWISYIVFELPSMMACKVIGPGWFLPATTLGFGICSLGTAWVTNVASAAGVRFCLGIFETGMMPGIAYYLSRWYRQSELTFRLSLYIVTAPLAGAFGGLLASCILKLPHFGGLHGWRMIFAIEGIVTISLAIISFFTLTDRPASARWLNAEEKVLAEARVKSERVGTTEVLDKIDVKKTLRGIFCPVTLITSLIFLLSTITVGSFSFFAPTIVQTIYPDSTVISQQLHTVPPYLVGAFFVVLFPLLGWIYDNRMIFFICSAPLLMIGYIMFLASIHAMVRYGATFLVASSFAFGALCNAQVSANVVSDTARSAAIGADVMMANIGALISTWSFLPTDAPNYRIGNGINLATSSATLLLSISLYAWMLYDNKKRAKMDIDQALDGLTERQIQDLDWRHPGHKWRP